MGFLTSVIDKDEKYKEMEIPYTTFGTFLLQNLKNNIKDYLIQLRQLVKTRPLIIKTLLFLQQMWRENNTDEQKIHLQKVHDQIQKLENLPDFQGITLLKELFLQELQCLIQILECIKHEQLDNFTKLVIPLTKLKLSLEQFQQLFKNNQDMQESAFGQYIYYRNFHTVMKAKMYFLYTEYIVHMKSFKLQLEQAKQKKGCNTTKFLNEQLLYEILKKYTTLTPTCYICIFHCTQEKNSKLSQTKTSFLGQTLQPINEDKKQSSSQSQQSQQNLQKTSQNSQSLENHLGYFRRLQNIRASNLQRVGKYSIYYSNSQSLSREDVLKNQQKMFEYFEDLKSSIDFYTTRSKQDRESQRLIEFNFSRLNQKWYFASFLVRMTKNQQQQEEYRKKYMEFFNFLQNTWNYTSLATFDVDALKILDLNQQ